MSTDEMIVWLGQSISQGVELGANTRPLETIIAKLREQEARLQAAEGVLLAASRLQTAVHTLEFEELAVDVQDAYDEYTAAAEKGE